MLGSLSNEDGDAKDDALSKVNLYFTSEIRNCQDLFSAPLVFLRAELNMQWQCLIPNGDPKN